MLLSRLLTCVFLYLAAVAVSFCNADCVITIPTDMKANSPALLDREFNFIYPDKEKPTELRLKWFEDRLLYCPGSVLAVGNDKYRLKTDQPYDQPPTIRCLDGDQFELMVGNHPRPRGNLPSLLCEKNPDKVDRLTDHVCGPGKIVELGFSLGQNEHMKPIIWACYQDSVGTTLWTKATIRAAISANRVVDRSERWTKGRLFNDITCKPNYEGKSQLKTFVELFRDLFEPSVDPNLPAKIREKMINDYTEEYVAKYIRLKADGDVGTMSFDKGHLIANSDMYYVAEQSVTFFFVNAVPMWSSINRGNWKVMEGAVQRLALDKGDLEVWVGGLGVLQLENIDIYLGAARSNSNQRTMPVPKIIFKLVYSREHKQAIAYVAAHNPYMAMSELKTTYHLCPQNEHMSCRSNPKYTKIEFGYMYCCQAQDFLNHHLVRDIGLIHDIPHDVTPLV